MTREEILARFWEALEPLDYVYALWLEGADALDELDEYSDIDLNVDVEDSRVSEVFQLVERLFPMDQIWETGGSDEFINKVYHVAGASDYLMIDFNLHLHSAGGEGCTFYAGDQIDAAKVLFDKTGVVVVHAHPQPVKSNPERVRQIHFFFSQACRVRKYILRAQFPEAYIYYNKYIIDPLVRLIRMKYTPTKTSYYMVHISRHIPEDALARLTRLLQNPDFQALSAHLEDAIVWYHELCAELKL